MKNLTSIAVALCLIFTGFAIDPAQGYAAEPKSKSQVASSSTNVDFDWAFGVYSEKDKKLISVDRDTALKSGDDLKMLINISKECFVYVIHYGPKDEVELLFPYNLQQFKTDYKINKNYYIPEGKSWSTLDQQEGKEVFFIVASNKRIPELEDKLSAYMSAPAGKKTALAKEVVSEVRGVRKRFANYTTVAEKPVTIGGSIRGTGKAGDEKRPDIATIAKRVTAQNLYTKTITIDHK